MDWLDRIASVRRWGQNGYRAPHEPLLLPRRPCTTTSGCWPG
ncbi:hypothetical protein ACFXKD_16685 [Nocardiopsis aegyptia]